MLVNKVAYFVTSAKYNYQKHTMAWYLLYPFSWCRMFSSIFIQSLFNQELVQHLDTYNTTDRYIKTMGVQK